VRIDHAEVIPIEVPLAQTFYGGTYSMNRRCTRSCDYVPAAVYKGRFTLAMNASSKRQYAACYSRNCSPMFWGTTPVK
jgi:hypothetical protein